jgi:hypothetical protein
MLFIDPVLDDVDVVDDVVIDDVALGVDILDDVEGATDDADATSLDG